jgi:hypothetical protein
VGGAANVMCLSPVRCAGQSDTKARARIHVSNPWSLLAICTHGAGCWWVWHPSGANAGLKLTCECTRTRHGIKMGAGANSHLWVPIGPCQLKTIYLNFLFFCQNPSGVDVIFHSTA